MTLILLFIAYAAAAAAALYTARKLAPRDPLHNAALTLSLLLANLMLPPALTGLLGTLTPLGLIMAGIVLWGAEVSLARNLAPLPDEHLARGAVPSWHRWSIFLGTSLIFGTVFLFVVYTLFFQENVSSTDAIYHYLPNIINVVQSGSLFEMNGFLSYFPLGFEAIFTWEIALSQTFQHTNAFHTLLYVGGILYAVLLLRWLLRDAPPAARMLSITGGTLLLLTVNTTITMLGGTGKNDFLLWMCGMGSVYYLLRYWWDSRDQRFLVLTGIALGLAASSKLTAFAWIGVLGVAHLALLVRERRLRHLLRDGLAVGLPIVVVFLPWGLRMLVGLDYGAAPNLTRLGMENTVITQIFAPQFTETVPDWLPSFAIMIAALGLILWLPERLRTVRILCAVVLLITLTLVFIDRNFALYQIGMALIVVASVMVLSWSVREHGAFAHPLQIVMSVVLLSAAVFAISPFSACLTCDELHRYTAIMYRYSPATGALFCLALIALVTVRLTTDKQTHDWTQPTSSGIAPLAMLLTQAGLFVFIVAIFAQQSLMPRPLPAVLNTLPSVTGNPPPLREWVDENIRDTNIYSINEAPILLYGEDLSNHVYYVIPGHEGYYGDQPYEWSDIQGLIADYDLTYIVVTFRYVDLMQAALKETPEVAREIAQMRANLPVVYDNGSTVVFAVQAVANSSDCPIASHASR